MVFFLSSDERRSLKCCKTIIIITINNNIIKICMLYIVKINLDALSANTGNSKTIIGIQRNEPRRNV